MEDKNEQAPEGQPTTGDTAARETMSLDDVLAENSKLPHLDALRYFRYGHLPVHLQLTSMQFGSLAMFVAGLPASPQRTICLNKLLEAKDAGVRAALVSGV